MKSYFNHSGSLNDPDCPDPVSQYRIDLIPVDEADEHDGVAFFGTYSDAISEAQDLAKSAPYKVARTSVTLIR